MPHERPPISNRALLTTIVVALAAWGAYAAIGSYLYNLNPWRAVIVLACMATFLGLWMILLWNQQRARRH
jgi:hypothetical protein